MVSPITRVLVVDDHDGLRTQMRQILSMQAGVVADDAWNGRAAIDLIRKNAYDVITLDLNMPEMTGFEVIDEIEKSWPDLIPRIVVMTAYPRSAVERLGDRCLVVSKPFNAGELVEAVQNRCTCAKQQTEAGTAGGA
jgi:CheY-like chemotaxis protein